MTALNTHENRKALRESERKWGKPAIDAGWTLIPSTLLAKQQALGLDSIDVVIILQILKHWWHAGSAPFPSQVQLAKTMGVDLSTVKRHLNRLRDLGFIDWTARHTKAGGQASNAYDLSGLIKHVNDYAVEELEARARETDERKKRRMRKRARSGGKVLPFRGKDGDR